MNFTKTWLMLSTITTAMILPNLSWARSSLESRIDRLEVMVESRLKVQDLNELSQMKQQIQELHGLVEECQHELKILKDKQNNLIADKTVINKEKPTQKQPELLVEKTIKTAPVTQLLVSDHIAYENVYKLIESKKYDEAQLGLQDFLWKYPESKYIANAHYWLGEVYLTSWHADKSNEIHIEKAISEFKVVTEKYINHPKAVDCLLKLGLVELERENWLIAKEYFTTIINKYPDSSRAKIASMRLETLQEQGLI